MAAETVRIFTLDQDDDALEGVLVRVFDDAGAFVSQQYSSLVGADAIADFTLDGDDPAVDYTIRLSKAGVAFDGSLGDDSKSPQAIAIYSPAANSPTGTNDFEVQAQTFVRPVAADALLCRCSGYILDSQRNVVPNFSLAIRAWNPDATSPFALRALYGDLVTGKVIRVNSDNSGYVEFDLLRNSRYRVILEDAPDDPRDIYVPDASSIALTDLLFPRIRTVSYGTNPLALSVGESADADVTMTASDGRVFTPADNVLLFESSNTAVAAVSITGSMLVITGVGVGTAEITVTHVDETLNTYPEEPQSYTALTINVT